MRLEDIILVSVDDHIVEPPDLFARHLPRAFQDDAPKVVRDSSGADSWWFAGVQIPQIGIGATAGRPKEEWGIDPTSYDEMRPGCFDVDARVQDMNVNGVLGSLNFPSFPGFAGRQFSLAEPKVALAVVRAYNDWHVDEWCASAPGRFIPMGVAPAWDPMVLADEVRRLATKGCHAISFPENPAKLGYPSVHTDHWDPFWQACCDEGTVVCVHIGSAGESVVTTSDAPVDVLCTLQAINLVCCAADLLWSPVLRRFPDLQIALSEGGIGWIPYYLERVDRWQEMQEAWTGQEFGDLRPSDVFRQHFITCFIQDPGGLKNRADIGIDSITWECDYPHSDSTWPRSPETLLEECNAAGLTDDEIDKITHENAIRLFRYDPFAHIRREDCTVGALRRSSPDVDVHTGSIGRQHSIGGTAKSLSERLSVPASR